MQQHTSYMRHTKIKKRTQDGNPYGTHEKYHNNNTPGTTGCQIKEEKNESNKYRNERKGYEKP